MGFNAHWETSEKFLIQQKWDLKSRMAFSNELTSSCFYDVCLKNIIILYIKLLYILLYLFDYYHFVFLF